MNTPPFNFRLEINDEHREALRGMENALANDCVQKLQQCFPELKVGAATGVVIQFIDEVEALKRANRTKPKG